MIMHQGVFPFLKVGSEGRKEMPQHKSGRGRVHRFLLLCLLPAFSASSLPYFLCVKSLINRQTKSERLRRQSGAASLDQTPEIQAVKIPAVYALSHHSVHHSAHHFHGHPERHPRYRVPPAHPGISALSPRGSPSLCAARVRVWANKLCTTKVKLFPQTTKFHHSINLPDIVLYVYSL